MYKVDNFNKIEKLLVFKEDIKVFYVIFIIERKKDNPNLRKNSVRRGIWYIRSKSDLEKYKEDIINLCKLYNSRAYISISPRSLKKFAGKCLLEYSKRVVSGDFGNIFDLPHKLSLSEDIVQSRGGVLEKPRWIVDVDSLDTIKVEEVRKILEPLTTIQEEIDTPSGIHFIIDSFNTSVIEENRTSSDFDYTFPTKNVSFTIRKSGLTILYAWKAVNPLIM